MQENDGQAGQKGKILGTILIALAVICFIGAAVFFIKNAMEDKQAQGNVVSGGDTENQTMPDNTQGTDETTEPSESEPEESTSAEIEPEETEPEKEEPVLVENPYKDYYLGNSDMVAWLSVPGTVIDYPVMQTPEDENYYLYLNYDKKSDKNGSLILDTDSCLNPIGTNLIIHGHNMKSGAMFGDLQNYEDESYYAEHKNMILYTKECQRNYEVIAVFYTQVYKKTDTVFKFYKFFQADTEEEFLDYYDNIKALSLYDTGVTAEFGDRFLTLSTCSYQVKNGRFVVVAKEVEPGDSYAPLMEETE